MVTSESQTRSKNKNMSNETLHVRTFMPQNKVPRLPYKMPIFICQIFSMEHDVIKNARKKNFNECVRERIEATLKKSQNTGRIKN